MTTFFHGPILLTAIATIWTGLETFTVDLLGRSRHHHHAQTYEYKTKPYATTTTTTEDDTVDLTLYTEEAQADYIRNLPGLDYDPGFHQFAGYLTVGVDKHGRSRRLFYWYMESQASPESDPVVWWSNGGPGCSGLIGMGTEHGPFFINASGALRRNPWSWNSVANMLYVEQPAGVGFSYSENQDDYYTGDQPAAQDNYQMILAFLERFPERQGNPFYISSESYGGHYMPQLTLEIFKHREQDKHNNEDDQHPKINFQGMMVGNPFVDPFTNDITQIQAFYSHGLLAKPLYDQWHKQCTSRKTYDSRDCEKMQIAMFQELYGKINPYALDYPICLEKKDKRYEYDNIYGDRSYGRRRRRLETDTSSQVQQLLNYSTAGGPPFLPTHDIYRPCSEEHLDVYLNRLDVQQALHVIHTVPKDVNKKWRDCSDQIHYSGADFADSIIDIYKDVLKLAIKHDFQVFIFSGDDDSVCSTAGTQAWIYDLGYSPKADALWLHWKVEGEVAGFYTQFELKDTTTKGQFSFVTVHGAGHEVPAYRPMEALEMFKKVLHKEW